MGTVECRRQPRYGSVGGDVGPSPLLKRHQELLERALEAIRTREHWSPFPEEEAAYGERAAAEGEAAYRELLGEHFELDQPGGDGTVGPEPARGGERSPYGGELGISYPHSDPSVLLPAMTDATASWRAAGPWERAAVCAEILTRINARSFEFAHAAVHTSGHNFLMAFHAGAVHAQDRGLEAVAYALFEQTRLPSTAIWRKPMPEGEDFVLAKTFTVVPRGVGLVVANRVFPTWNGYPGLFASLATGNAVLVKPHPRAVLPLALTVRIAREVLADAGHDPNVVCLVAERPGERSAKDLATRPEVRIVDYSGSAEFGRWLEDNARQAQVFTAKSAVNSLLVESTARYRDMLYNVAFSLALYSGQLCTSPQNLLIPRTGISTDEGHKTYARCVEDLAAAVTGLLADDAEAVGVLGALIGPDVLARVEYAASGAVGPVALAPRAVAHPRFPAATVRTPTLVALDAARDRDRATLRSEWLGPVAFAVAVDSAADGIELMRRTAQEEGALSVGVYTTSPEVEAAVEDACERTGVMLSVNLVGNWFITQSAVYSDLHSTGLNPSGNSVYCDGAYVAGRFRTVGVRRYGTGERTAPQPAGRP
ncbi:phenylacetic acid degradation protein PaaN [Streptomyces sp. AM 4-1-1]|uniref:phenylacetic acid degradation protein PaaN n=1 Tax=Streptomyces sp. AM 4-1-1 TaxID=3028710 RepID=UPI0023BA1371|nr:phenylacetic acid degradation protein PaaN [Streptomyces sp. AM 4-1-1]WEH35136.1 phenylacetic acid degradation protein PaaN [Streptomyces sp. AM 4-1-1]